MTARASARAQRALRGLARQLLPAALAVEVVRPLTSGRRRAAAGITLVGVWTYVYARYRRGSSAQTAHEQELLRTASATAFSRHYNECVPTIEEEFALWGPYHQHRHEMRYDLVAAAVRRHLRPGGSVLDVGSGSALVGERLLDLAASYVGLDFGGHHVEYGSSKLRPVSQALETTFVRGDAEHLPFSPERFDVVVLSEVIEHLLRPELAVWELARVLRPGGVLVLTTNNASEVPLRSPLTHLFAWLEKALGFNTPRLISSRPWVWPEPVDPEVLPEGAGEVYIPHTHHIAAELRHLLGEAGLATTEISTFEFPPPQSATARWLDRSGRAGRWAADGLEVVARGLPLVNRMGCHLFLVARRVGDPVAPAPPPGIWPGPFSS